MAQPDFDPEEFGREIRDQVKAATPTDFYRVISPNLEKLIASLADGPVRQEQASAIGAFLATSLGDAASGRGPVDEPEVLQRIVATFATRFVAEPDRGQS